MESSDERPQEKPKEKRLYRVILLSANDPDQAAETLVRRLPRESENRLRSIVRSLPAEVATNLDALYAEDLAGALRETGAEAEKRIIPSSVICKHHEGQKGTSQCMVCSEVICNECIKEAKGQRLCMEHSGADKEEMPSTFPWVRVVLLLILIGVGAFAYYTVTKGREPFPFDRPYRLAVVGFIADSPENILKYIKHFQEDTGTEYVDLDNHTLPHAVGWFQREYNRYGGTLPQALELETFGPYSETEIPPEPPTGDQNYFDRFLQWKKFEQYFNRINDKHELDLSEYDGVVYVRFVKEEYEGFLESWASRSKNIALVQCYVNINLIEQNIMIVLHEYFHLLNAKDHYDEYLNPVNPEGLVEPFMESPYPQTYADVMAGAVAMDEESSRDIQGLMDLRVNIYTAYEIGWISKEDFLSIINISHEIPPLN